MTDDSIPRSILLVVLIIAGGFFAGSETAFSYCNAIRLKTLAEDGNKRAKRAVSVWEDFDKALVTILIGTNVIYIAASSIATVMAVSLMGKSGSVVSTVALTLLIFMFSETIPKNIAKANSDSFALAAAPVLRFLMIILTPVAAAVTVITNLLKKLLSRGSKEPTMTGDEFQAVVETIESEGILEPEEGRIIRSAVEFSDIRAMDVMTPRDEIIAIDIASCNEKVKETLLNEKYSRIPVYSGSIDNIIGVIRTKVCLLKLKNNRPPELLKSITPPYLIAPESPIDTLFEDMSRYKNHLAVVTAQDGSTLGIVTMEDILEVIVGDINDEDDGPAAMPAPAGRSLSSLKAPAGGGAV